MNSKCFIQTAIWSKMFIYHQRRISWSTCQLIWSGRVKCRTFKSSKVWLLCNVLKLYHYLVIVQYGISWNIELILIFISLNEFKPYCIKTEFKHKMKYMYDFYHEWPNTTKIGFFLTFRLGPLVRSWCMRFEAKHHYFKKLSTVIGNYTNLPYTYAPPTMGLLQITIWQSRIRVSWKRPRSWPRYCMVFDPNICNIYNRYI
jgi:hypothetical protein